LLIRLNQSRHQLDPDAFARYAVKLKTALVYVRQSRTRDYERTASPEVQRKACLELPVVRACNHVEVFEDLDASGGGTRGRRGYLRMLDYIRDPPVDVVAAYDQSRTFRNTADALAFFAMTESRQPASWSARCPPATFAPPMAPSPSMKRSPRSSGGFSTTTRAANTAFVRSRLLQAVEPIRA
jgi:Resolvase, N terminal domain